MRAWLERLWREVEDVYVHGGDESGEKNAVSGPAFDPSRAVDQSVEAASKRGKQEGMHP